MTSDRSENLEESGGRDERGRFVKGHNGLGGRPRGFDLVNAAKDMATRKGLSLHEALGDVLYAMLGKAKDGDVQAAKLIFERLCLKNDFEADPGRAFVLQVVTGVPQPADDDDDDDDDYDA